MARLGFMKSFPKAMLTAVVGGCAAVLISTPLNIMFWGGTTGNVWGDALFAVTQKAGMPVALGSFLDELVVDVPDKLLTVIVVFLILKGLPKKLTSKWGISKARFYLSASNLFVLTNYSGYDPEVDIQTGLTCGMDYNRYPRARRFTIGTNITF